MNMRSSDWKVWRYLTKEDADWIVDKDVFKSMIEQGWHCRTILWIKNDEMETYPENLLKDIKKVSPYIEWPEKIEDTNKQGLACALTLLQEEVQTILRLRYYHGASYARIAELFELSTEGVRQIISRAIKELSQEPYRSLLKLGLDGYINQQTAMRNNEFETYCFECGKRIAKLRNKQKYDGEVSERQKRIASIDKFLVEIEGPEYAYFGFTEESVQRGFCLTANVTNVSTNIHTVNIEDFFLVRNGTKIPSNSKLRGTTFGDNILIPNQTQQTGLIWYESNIGFIDMLSDDVSIVVCIQVDGEASKLVYKFGNRDDRFELDDFCVIGNSSES